MRLSKFEETVYAARACVGARSFASMNALSKVAAAFVPSAPSVHTRARRASVAWSAPRVNGERSRSSQPSAASESVRLRWFLIGVAFTQLINIVLALWVRAGGL